MKRLEVARIEGAAPTLVFLHEGLGSVSAWRDFPARLAAASGRAALIYSRAGYGASERAPPPWPLDFMRREAGVLSELLDDAGLPAATLVGHSDGATIALLFAAAAPERTDGLVLLAPHVFREELTRASIAAAVVEYERGGLRARLERHHGANVDDAFRGWSGVWLDPAFGDWSIAADLPGVRAPALVIQGAADPYGTLAQVDAVATGCRGPVETVVLPGCGHAPHRERPEETIAAAIRFLDTRSSRRP